MDKTGVSIIIPAYNEAQSIGDIVSKIVELYPEFEVIVINDGSTDDTDAVARGVGAHVYNHPYNIGNGAAIKSGIRIAKGDILVFMDGDNRPHWGVLSATQYTTISHPMLQSLLFPTSHQDFGLLKQMWLGTFYTCFPTPIHIPRL